jgi:hypothetical protein
MPVMTRSKPKSAVKKIVKALTGKSSSKRQQRRQH